MNQSEPRVLVISHNCFSRGGANGRTLANFFEGYPSEKLAQLYIVNETPDTPAAGRYFRITDADVLKACLTLRNAGKVIQAAPPHSQVPPRPRRIKKSAAAVLLRDFIWKLPLWRKKRLNGWIDAFRPQVVLFQAGDAGFLCRLALSAAQKRGIPLIVYNSEGYYFKKYDYLAQRTWRSPLFRLHMRRFRQDFAKMMQYAQKSVYISRELQAAYEREFQRPGDFIMTSTAVAPCIGDAALLHTPPKITYAGNLGVGRDKSLIEIANALQKISADYRLEVYGSFPDKSTGEALLHCEGIHYRGVLPYDKVVQVLRESDINVHVEGFGAFFEEDSKYAFSTKIADILASGKCLLLYAPAGLTAAGYIAANSVGCVVSRQSDLQKALTELLTSQSLRQHYAANAVKLAARYHNLETNRQKFQSFLGGVI